MIDLTKLVINSKGVFVDGKHVANLVIDRIKGLWTHTPTEEEVEEIGPDNKLIVGDKAIINLPSGVPVNITITGDVFGKIDISSCTTFTIKGNMKGNVDLSSGDIKINGDVTGNVRGGSCTTNIGGNVGGEIHVSAGTVKIGGQ